MRKGREVTCLICGRLTYRRLSKVWIKTCGSKECRSAWMRGENNPFWGKNHSPEMKEHLRAARAKRPYYLNKGGRPKGSFTPEERAAQSARMKEAWRKNRDLWASRLPRGGDHHWKKLNKERRYRIQFTPFQRKNWKDSQCLWCDAIDPDDLVLDHIVSVMAGGKSIRENAQTLCRACNLWKMVFIDRPYYLAILGCQGGQT